MAEIPLKTVVHITKDNIYIYILYIYIFFFFSQDKIKRSRVMLSSIGGKIHNNVNIGNNKETLKTL